MSSVRRGVSRGRKSRVFAAHSCVFSHLAQNLALGLALADDVEEGGLARAAGTHDGAHVPGVDGAGDLRGVRGVGVSGGGSGWRRARGRCGRTSERSTLLPDDPDDGAAPSSAARADSEAFPKVFLTRAGMMAPTPSRDIWMPAWRASRSPRALSSPAKVGHSCGERRSTARAVVFSATATAHDAAASS